MSHKHPQKQCLTNHWLLQQRPAQTGSRAPSDSMVREKVAEIWQNTAMMRQVLLKCVDSARRPVAYVLRQHKHQPLRILEMHLPQPLTGTSKEKNRKRERKRKRRTFTKRNRKRERNRKRSPATTTR